MQECAYDFRNTNYHTYTRAALLTTYVRTYTAQVHTYTYVVSSIYTILQSKPISSMDPHTQDMVEKEREQKKQNLFPFIAQEKTEGTKTHF